MPLLAVDNLHLWYDAGGDRVVRAVDDVSFTIEDRGEAIGIVGPRTNFGARSAGNTSPWSSRAP